MTSRILALSALACGLLARFAPPALSAVLRVSQQAGGPAHDGQSWQSAFLNIPDAVSAAALGDEIWVAAGAYGDNITISQDMSVYGGFSGSETIRSQRDPLAHPSLLSATALTWLTLEASVGPASVIDGFTFGKTFLITLHGGSPTISNSIFQGGSPGVGTGTNYPNSSARVLHNTFLAQPQGAGAPCIFFGGGSPVIQGNILNGVYLRYDPLSVNGDLGSPMIVGNKVTSGNEAIYVVAYAPYVADNVAIGAEMYVRGGAATIVNNTVVGSRVNGLSFPSLTQGCIVANNIVAFNGYGMVPASGTAADDPVTLFNNCVYGNSRANYPPGWKDATGFQGNISVDPQLVSRNGDLHLAATSPLIDAGNDAYVQPSDTDVAGNPRIQGARVDIGAYEFGGNLFTMGDAAGALRLHGGLSAATPDLVARLNLESGAGLDLRDAVRLARKAAGLDLNP